MSAIHDDTSPTNERKHPMNETDIAATAAAQADRTITLDPEMGGDVTDGWAHIAVPKDQQAISFFLGDGCGPATITDSMPQEEIADYFSTPALRAVFAARLFLILGALQDEDES